MVPEAQGGMVIRPVIIGQMWFWVALAAALAMLASIGLAVFAVVLRYRGRAVPRSLIRLGAGLFGASNGIFLIYMVRADFAWVALAIVAGSFGFDLVRRGHRIAAGILLVTLGLPSGLWWGQFVVGDLLDPASLYLPELWLWWAPGPVLLVVGATLIARGDRAPRAPRTLFQPMPAHVRDPAAIADGLQRALGIGGIPIQVLIAMVAAMVPLFFGVPAALAAGVPWPVVLVLGTGFFVVVAAELNYFALPRRIRLAWEGWSMVGDPEMKRWQATIGTPIPIGTPAVQRWLEANPETPENRWARSELLVIAGQMDEARAVAERLPDSTEWERFESAAQIQFVDWVEGHDADMEQFEAMAEAVGQSESQERWLARAMVASARARDIAVRGGDWTAPLIDIRRRAGPLADGLLRAQLRRRTYSVMLIVGLPFVGLVVLGSGFFA